MQDLVTVGIPTFNRPEGLRKTLTRITQQTYSNLEIIVSDNCSTDEQAVREVIAEFSGDQRVQFHRQKENLGSIGNFRFLAHQGVGTYFIYAADDDELESSYVEKLLQALVANPKAALAMSGYDVTDIMSKPPIFSTLTHHLYGLRGDTTYRRLKNYIVQPDHFGKSRLVWALTRTEYVRRAWAESLRATKRAPALIWPDLPLEVRYICYGDLAVVDETLCHVFLLPTSDGRQGLAVKLPKLMDVVSRGLKSYTDVVNDSNLADGEKRELIRIMRIRAVWTKVQLFVYYGVIGRWPGLARWIKKVWFFFA